MNLEDYCERALFFLEEMAAPFARLHPAQAGRLVRDARAAVDPHLERMIEASGLLAGRIDHKVGSEFPHLVESLLQVLYPHWMMLIPSFAVAQLRWRDAGAAAARPTPHTIPAGAMFTSRPLGKEGVPCQYRTGYATTLGPLELESAEWQAVPLYDLRDPPHQTAAALRWRWPLPGTGDLRVLPAERARLYLHGDRQFVVRLYENLFLHCLRIDYRLLDGDTEVVSCKLAPADCLHQVGLDLSEGLLPLPKHVFPGYRHLLEVIAFPEKHFFVDVDGWRPFREAAAGRNGNVVETVLYFRQTHETLERNLSARNFLLGCTPLVNLFPKSAEPIDVHHRQSEYRIRPALAEVDSHEIYSVEEVNFFDPAQDRQGRFEPFFAAPVDSDAEPEGYWLVSRRPAGAAARTEVSAQTTEDMAYHYWAAGLPTLEAVEVLHGTEMYVRLVDRNFDPKRPSDMMLDVQVLCSNRDVPSRFQHGGDILTGAGDASVAQAVLLETPTRPLRPPLRAAYWRLLSQNSLNHVALAQAPFGRQAFQELLRLCDFTGPETRQLGEVVRQMIDGVMSIRSKPVQAWVRARENPGLCRGQEVEVELDERQYGNTGVLVFASVLERFFALYTALNSFSQLVAKTTQSKEPLKKWPPRAAQMQLV